MPATSTASLASEIEDGGPLVGPFLTLVMNCSALEHPSVRISLAEVDEVCVKRSHEQSIRFDGPRRIAIGVSDRALSEQHFCLCQRKGTWTVRDCGSKNGTVVNQQKIAGPTDLRDGDVISAAHVFFVFRRRTHGVLHSESILASSTFADQPQPCATFQPGLQRTVEVVTRLAGSRVPVLVLGESGTGKERMARTIHELSGRPGRYVGVNCGSIPESLLESELFGHRRGAFSGASEDRIGWVRSADRGTLFLDEIAEMRESSQVALLRVLQENEVVPVGDTTPIAVDLRVVAATHRDVRVLVDSDRIRGDLLSRLSGYIADLPPLRERREDLGILVRQFLAGTSGRVEAGLSIQAAQALFAHRWPSNIRELEHALKTAAVLAGPGKIGLHHLPFVHHTEKRDQGAPSSEEQEGRDRQEGQDPARINELLRLHNGNISAVARALATSRTQVKRLMERYGID